MILFRCDGVANTGLGHVSRCLALAQAFEEIGFASCFLGRFEAGATDMLDAAGREYLTGIDESGSEQDIRETTDAARRRGADAILVDSYLVGDDYIASLHHQVAPVLLLDDYGKLDRYDCAAVMSFLVGAGECNYPTDRVPCFLGPEYFPARRELRQLRHRGKELRPAVDRVLVVIGGVDLQDLTGRAVRALLDVAPHLAVHVVVGRSHERVAELSQLVGGFAGGGEVFVQLPTLAGEYAWTDVVISGGGMIKYESAYLGLPAGIISQNEDQKHETAQFAKLGLVFDLGLGSEQSDASLAVGVGRLLADQALRESLHRTGLAVFPEDPALRAVRAYAGALKRGDES